MRQSRQGRRLPKEKVTRIQRLLAETDMTLSEIVESVGCSKSVVGSINQKYGIRNYSGRSNWSVNKDWKVFTTPGTRGEARPSKTKFVNKGWLK